MISSFQLLGKSLIPLKEVKTVKTVELGVAGTIAVKQISGDFIAEDINKWLEENADVVVIDIKFSASATSDEWGVDALIIYRKDV